MKVEVVHFALRTGTSTETFRAVNDRFQEDVAYQSAGMLRRTVACNEEGKWVDVRVWSDDSPCETRGDTAVRLEWESMVDVLSRDVYSSL